MQVATAEGSRGQSVTQLDAVVVPVSGGGLISGIATVIKACAPDCKVRCYSNPRTSRLELACMPT